MPITSDILALADFPTPFAKCFTVTAEEVDGFGHVNNAVYLKWIDAAVWDDTARVGLDADACREINRGMAVFRHEIDYLASAYLNDEVVVFVWISANDNRLRCTREFQLVRLSDKKTLLRAKTDYICTNLTSGRPAKMPEEFKLAYRPTLLRDSGTATVTDS